MLAYLDRTTPMAYRSMAASATRVNTNCSSANQTHTLLDQHLDNHCATENNDIRNDDVSNPKPMVISKIIIFFLNLPTILTHLAADTHKKFSLKHICSYTQPNIHKNLHLNTDKNLDCVAPPILPAI